MPLDEYRRKRHFGKTPEPNDAASSKRPAGRRTEASGLSFVVQKHAASTLHYDFRLEHEGVLLSWAVPKGPSLDPAQKRLAVRVEDHPLAYAAFEGSIPAGEYGAGEVIVWDRGTWEPDGDAASMLAAGRLRFRLVGEKLAGGWSLVRTGARGGRNWLLIKSRDAAAVPLAQEDVLSDRPESVLSGRTVGAAREGKSGEKEKRRSVTPHRAVASRPKARSMRRVMPDQEAAMPIEVAGVRVTSPGRVVYPEAEVTKGELAAYVAAVSDRLLAEVAGRPLALVRCPDGLSGDRFFQKHPAKWTPGSVLRLEVDGEPKPWLGLRDVAGLVALVQMGTIEFHPWGARADRPDKPDRMTFDLDPGEAVPWEEVVAAAVLVRGLLDEAGLASFVLVTGGKGLHVVVPLARRQGWDGVTEYAKRFATRLAESRPDQFTTTAAKAVRRGRIYLDYLRNGRGATAVAAYSPRARPAATVATPVSWDELTAGVSPSQFTVRTAPDRLAALRTEPWEGFRDVRQSLTARVRRSVGL